MKILMLNPYLPYPLYSGGQIRTYNLLKNLASKHEITLFSFIRNNSEKKHIKQLKKFCVKVKVFKRRPAWDLKNVMLAAISPYPFVLIATYLSFNVRRAIKNELKDSNYDLIHAEPFYMMPNIPKTNIPILMVEQTIEHLVYKKFVDHFKLVLLRPLLYFDVLKLKFWEEFYWNKATRIAAMSEEDRQIMKKSLKNKKIDVVANGVDIDFFSKTKTQRLKVPTVLFVGNFKWLPNKDAAKFLTYKVWPKIKKEIPKAKLWIVGRNPTARIRSLALKKDVIVQGNINDIRQAFGRASVLLAPIRNGRGTKYKVLEAMATKLPVVSTPLGIEGINIEHNNCVLVAKKASDLAAETVKILKKPSLGKRLANNAFKLVKTKYNWKSISQNLDNIYQELGK